MFIKFLQEDRTCLQYDHVSLKPRTKSASTIQESRVPLLADAYGRLPRGREHEEDEINVAQYGQLLGLLEDARPPFRVGDLPPAAVLQLLDFQFDPPHRRRRRSRFY